MGVTDGLAVPERDAPNENDCDGDPELDWDCDEVADCELVPVTLGLPVKEAEGVIDALGDDVRVNPAVTL